MRLIVILVFPVFLFLSSCATVQKFDRLRTANKGDSILYVLRPTQPSQSLFAFEVELYRYEGSFKTGKRSLVAEWPLDSGEFTVLELKPGFYSLKCKDMDKIFLLKEGVGNFISLELFNRGTFSLPGLFIRELDAEKALGYLLEGNRMYQIKEESNSAR